MFVLSGLYQTCEIFPSSIILLNRIYKICTIFLPPIQSISTVIPSSPAHLLFVSCFSANLISEFVNSGIPSETVLSTVLSGRCCCCVYIEYSVM